MPIQDQEASYLLARLRSELQQATDRKVAMEIQYRHEGKADGISLVIEQFGPEWAKEAVAKLWQGAEKSLEKRLAREERSETRKRS